LSYLYHIIVGDLLAHSSSFFAYELFNKYKKSVFHGLIIFPAVYDLKFSLLKSSSIRVNNIKDNFKKVVNELTVFTFFTADLGYVA